MGQEWEAQNQECVMESRGEKETEKNAPDDTAWSHYDKEISTTR